MEITRKEEPPSNIDYYKKASVFKMYDEVIQLVNLSFLRVLRALRGEKVFFFLCMLFAVKIFLTQYLTYGNFRLCLS